MRSLTILTMLFLVGCSKERVKPTLFTDISQSSGIQFSNNLSFTERLNPYTYRNLFNGAGVAVGDINNDGLLDIYFGGNQVDNKLYLNQGDLQFKDITDKAGVACAGVWSAGVSFVDINADGYLDIYVCKSGDPDVPHRNNELFINNKDLTFTERSKEYGLDITGLSVQAAFFDYDKDGDLDCYILTNSIRSVGNYDLVKDQRKIPDPLNGGNKFLINEHGKFRDYSEKAGIYRSTIGFGLGITLGDFNDDSWTDIFVSNDFFERDYLYINDQHGAFTESLEDHFQSISMGSMGADFADLDNDTKPELFVTEMLPDSLNRKKTKTFYENWNKYQLNVQNGYYHQFSRNVLQKKTGRGNYAEIGRLAGVAASEWSWGALLFDMDNDGRKDIFIANGIYKDLLDRDYLTYTGAEDNVRKILREEKNPILKLVGLMPSSRFPDYAFRNDGNLKFENVTAAWGLDKATFSNGSAYGDFDNDGDLDLVVNNLGEPSTLYRNNSDSSTYKSVTIELSSQGPNTFVVGASVTVFCGTKKYFADNYVIRGFQSSVQPRITLGLGDSVKVIDSLLVAWPAGGYTVLYDLPVNRKVSLVKEEARIADSFPWKGESETGSLRLEPVSQSLFRHRGSGLIDFNRDRLLPMMASDETPSMVKGDIDHDGVDEVYIGGGKGQPGTFLRFTPDRVTSFLPPALGEYNLTEETQGALVDVDNDGDLDLCTAAGGRFFSRESSALTDRIFFNNGSGNFSEAASKLIGSVSTSVIKAIDFDNDGDQDLLVGERFDPFVYGRGGRGYLFENDGKGSFKDVTAKHAPDLISIGMITDIEVQDMNGDHWQDAVIVGDWMPIVALQNNNGSFSDVSRQFGFRNTEGWWHDIAAGDLNRDGKIDFVFGNHGLNSFFKTGDRMYLNDFDGNGSMEQIFCTSVGGKYYPIVDKDELLSQLPSLKKTLLYYKDYGKKSIDDLFPKTVIDQSKIFQANLLASVLLLSDRDGYAIVELPLEAQYGPLYSLLIADFDNDGVEDVIAGGNQYQVKPQFGRYDASNGWFFKGELDKGKFRFLPGADLNVKGQIRDIEYVNVKGTKYILFSKYDSDLEIDKISH